MLRHYLSVPSREQFPREKLDENCDLRGRYEFERKQLQQEQLTTVLSVVLVHPVWMLV